MQLKYCPIIVHKNVSRKRNFGNMSREKICMHTDSKNQYPTTMSTASMSHGQRMLERALAMSSPSPAKNR